MLHETVDRTGLGVDALGHIWKRYPSGVWWTTSQSEPGGRRESALPILDPVTSELRASVVALRNFRSDSRHRPDGFALRRQEGELNAFDMVLRLIDGGEEAVDGLPTEQPPVGGFCGACGHYAGRHNEEGCHFDYPGDKPDCDCPVMIWRGRSWPRPWLAAPAGLRKED